ncbi:MAG: Ig-like domain-containing protein [Pseudomonadota bacterium]
MSSETIVFEAEDLVLEDFQVVHGSQASGGKLIKITDDTGTAATDFGHATGIYQVSIWVQDENDGQSTIELVVDGIVVGILTLDRDDDGNGSNNGGFSEFVLDDIMIEAGAEFELRAYKDGGEWVRIDKIELTKTADLGDSTGPASGVETLMSEGFAGKGHILETSSNIEHSDFERKNNAALTDGNDDGSLVFRAIDLSGYENAKITLDAKVLKGGFEAWGTQYGDMVRIEIVDQDGTVHLLDMFSGTGNAMTGSETGQVIDKGGFDALSWDIPAGLDSAQIRIVSDISASGEKIVFDNLTVTAEPATGGGGDPVTPVVYTLDAMDDVFSVGEAEDIAANLLANDVTDSPEPIALTGVEVLGTANAGLDVTLGQAFTVTTAGGRDGTVTVNADGSFTFDGGENFTDLTQGQTDSFQLTYTAQIAAEDQVDHNLLFVLDISNSTVNGNNTAQDVFEGTGVGDVNGDGLADTVLDAQIAGVLAAVQNLIAKGADPSKIDIGIVTFSGRASGYTNIDAETLGTFGLGDPALSDALTGITRGGWTNYEAGLEQARDWFGAQSGDGAVNKMYFLSDGRPAIGYVDGAYVYQDESDYGDEVAAIANTYGAEIHAIGVGANSDLAYLDQIDNTDGAEQVLDTTSLTAMLEETTSVLVEDTATVTVTVNGEGVAVTIDAVDDAFSVAETEDVAANILANDTTDAPGGLAVTAIAIVNDDASQTDVTLGESFTVTTAGGRTGTVTVTADGTFTFDGGSAFEELNTGETDSFRLAYTASAGGQTSIAQDIDFDMPDLPAGTVITDQIAGVSISAIRAGQSNENMAMIFDAANPTGGDSDLFQPGEGKVLIISEDGDSSDPDDNASGGTFFFAFDTPSTVTSLTFLDTEEPVPLVRLYDANDALIATLAGPSTPDGGLADMIVNRDGVARMEIDLQGSGAIAGLAFAETVAAEQVSDSAFIDVVITGEGVDLMPLAADDVLETVENQAATPLNILTDAPGADTPGDGPLTITDLAPNAGNPAGTGVVIGAPDGAGLRTVTLTVTDMVDGLPVLRTATATLAADGTLTLDPGTGFESLAAGDQRSWVLDYTIADADGDTSSASITLTVNGLNEPPVAQDDAIADVETAPAVSGNVLDNDSDPNGDEITVTAAGGQPAGSALTLNGVSDAGRPLSGVLTVQADGSYSFVPAPAMLTMAQDEVVVFAVPYTIADSFGAQAGATLTITLTGLNEAPIAVDDAVTVDEDVSAILGNVLANDSDPNDDLYTDDPISVIAAGGVAPGTTISLTGTSALGVVLTGTLTVQANGAYEFTPVSGFGDLASGDSVTFALDYTIEDSHGAQDSAQLRLTVDGLNDPPQATDNSYNTGEGEEFSGNLVTDDTGAGVDSDPNGDDIHVVDVTQDGGSLGAIGDSWTVLSDGGRSGTLTVNINGQFTFTPSAEFDDLALGEKDTVSLDYVIEDVFGLQSSASFEIDVLGSDAGGGGSGGDPEINLAFVVDASSSMFVNRLNGMADDFAGNGGDPNGDGVANTAFDLAYHGMLSAIAGLEAAAATAGKVINIGLIAFDDEANAAQTYTGQSSLEAWGFGNASSAFLLGAAGDSDIDVGVAGAQEWFTDIQAEVTDENHMVVLSDGQFAQGDVDTLLSEWDTDYAGTVHSRYIGDIFGATTNQVNAIEALSNDAVTPNDFDFKFYGFDLFSTEYALQPTDLLNLA